jgi:hypothetical protein
MSREIYVVVNFGCNSSANDMWIPNTYVFTDKEEAFKCYQDCAPDLNDRENIAERYEGNTTYRAYMEAIVQKGGYLSGYGNCAKRPYGAAIYKHTLTE